MSLGDELRINMMNLMKTNVDPVLRINSHPLLSLSYMLSFAMFSRVQYMLRC